MDTKAEFGIGTLTIFIGMILVGAVAAGVLIQTADTTQQQAYATGEETQKELVTFARVVEVSATDGTDGFIENFSLTVKLVPGSNPIKFDHLAVQFDTPSYGSSHNYRAAINGSTYCIVNNVSFGAERCAVTAPNLGSGQYTVQYMRYGKDPYDGALTAGDVMRIYFSTNASVAAGDAVRITLIPSFGVPTVIDTQAPDVIRETHVSVYP